MPTGDAFKGSEASGCWRNGARRSNGTLRISSTPAGWTGYMYEVAKTSHKKLLLQAAACNLALLMRSLYGGGKPRAAHDRRVKGILAILRFMSALSTFCTPCDWSCELQLCTSQEFSRS